MKDYTPEFIEFAAEIENLIRDTRGKGIEHCALSQISRSSTSIFANFAESQRAMTAADVRNKIAIASKEAYETKAWIHFIHKIRFIDDESFTHLDKWITNILLALDACTSETMTDKNPTDHMKMMNKIQGNKTWGKGWR